jgi:hypothetical protein
VTSCIGPPFAKQPKRADNPVAVTQKHDANVVLWGISACLWPLKIRVAKKRDKHLFYQPRAYIADPRFRKAGWGRR